MPETPPADAAERLLALFPSGTEVSAAGEVVIGGCPTGELAASFGTPTLVIDEGALRHRARSYRDGLTQRWPNSQVVWASKSLPYTAAYRLMSEEGLGIDVAGGGELFLALAAGADPRTMVMHGNAKTDDEIAMAVKEGVGTIVIDNFDDIERLERLASPGQRVLVRVTPGVDAPTHAANATGHIDSKFGLSPTDAAVAISQIRKSGRLVLDGVHTHIGSQILDTQPFVKAVEVISALGEFDVYNFGGGLGAKYTYDSHPPSLDDYLAALVDSARSLIPSHARIMIEPGRSLVASSGATLYRIISVKRSSRTFVAVDGGMGDNLEVSLYGQRFEATIANRVGGGERCTIVGRHCESGDQLIEDVALRDPKVGDLIAVPVTGAYCLTLANNYNGACRPPIVFVNNGVPRIVLRRETYSDLIRRDLS